MGDIGGWGYRPWASSASEVTDPVFYRAEVLRWLIDLKTFFISLGDRKQRKVLTHAGDKPITSDANLERMKSTIQSSMVSFGLNLRPARSADRNRNWLPYSSNSMWGLSRTVVLVASEMVLSSRGVVEDGFVNTEDGRVEYAGTANAKMEFCLGSTV